MAIYPKSYMTRGEAIMLAHIHGFDWRVDWHAMRSDAKEAVLRAADQIGYRKPRNANGSRGRCFAAYVKRAAERDE